MQPDAVAPTALDAPASWRSEQTDQFGQIEYTERAAILRRAHEEADRIRGELPLLKVSLDYELAMARERAAEAEERLAEARDEAQSLIKDAADQASLIADTAERSAEELLAKGRGEVADLLVAARVEAEQIRVHAEQLLDTQQRAAERLRIDVAAELDQRREDHERHLIDRREQVDIELSSTKAAAEHQIEQRRLAADAETGALIQSGRDALNAAHADAQGVRAQVREERARLLDEARVEAADELAAAAQQMTWTQNVVAALVAAAEQDARDVRRTAHLDSAAHAQKTRRRIADLSHTAEAKVQSNLESAERELHRAGLHLEDAERDAIDRREQAATAARRTLEEADVEARVRVERAERRLTEAEAGARSVREHVAQEMGRAQTSMHELRRASRTEAGETLERARAEAAEIQAECRRLVEASRAEVATLVSRRDAIAVELGSLSGVIHALSVPDGVRVESDSSAVGQHRPIEDNLDDQAAHAPHEPEHIDELSGLDEMMRAE